MTGTLEGLSASIDRFGLVEPIVWNKKTKRVVGGHQRLKVLQDRGASEVDVVVVDLPPAEEKALNVALKSPAIAGEFTLELEDLLDSIQGASPDLYSELLLAELRGAGDEGGVPARCHGCGIASEGLAGCRGFLHGIR